MVEIKRQKKKHAAFQQFNSQHNSLFLHYTNPILKVFFLNFPPWSLNHAMVKNHHPSRCLETVLLEASFRSDVFHLQRGERHFAAGRCATWANRFTTGRSLGRPKHQNKKKLNLQKLSLTHPKDIFFANKTRGMSPFFVVFPKRCFWWFLGAPKPQQLPTRAPEFASSTSPAEAAVSSASVRAEPASVEGSKAFQGA